MASGKLRSTHNTYIKQINSSTDLFLQICTEHLLFEGGEEGGASLVAQLIICLQCGRPGFDSWVGKIPWRRSILAWRIPRTEEPGGLQSIGSQRVGHNWVTTLSTIFWELGIRKWIRNDFISWAPNCEEWMSYSLQFEYCSHILYCLMMWLLFSNLFPSRAKIVFLASCTGFFFCLFVCFISLDTSQAVNSMTILVGLRFYSSSSQASRAQSLSLREGVFLCRPISDWSWG